MTETFGKRIVGNNVWTLPIKQDVFYDYREYMIDDIMSKNIIVGKSFVELEELFGKLEIQESNHSKFISQNIVTDFGSDIDPVKTLDLVIYLDKNNVATKTKLVEWKK